MDRIALHPLTTRAIRTLVGLPMSGCRGDDVGSIDRVHNTHSWLETISRGYRADNPSSHGELVSDIAHCHVDPHDLDLQGRVP